MSGDEFGSGAQRPGPTPAGQSDRAPDPIPVGTLPPFVPDDKPTILRDLAPALVEKLHELYDLWHARTSGSFVITSGMRSIHRQAQFYTAWHRDGKDVAREKFGIMGAPSPALISRHHPDPEYGWKATACDIAARGFAGNKATVQDALAQAAEEIGLVSGRTWPDPWHVELAATGGASKWDRYLKLAAMVDELIEHGRGRAT